MRAPPAPYVDLGDSNSLSLALRRSIRGIALSLLCLGCAPPPASAEVWPAAAAAQTQGPFAALEADALSLWSNPALVTRLEGWNLGAGWHEPFEVPSLTRSDMAFSRAGHGWGVAVGATRFGTGEIGATGWALAFSAPLGGDAARGGVALRRHAREEQSAWAGDLGLRLEPLPTFRLAVVARSVFRAGALETAPEPEWELAASWSRGDSAQRLRAD